MAGIVVTVGLLALTSGLLKLFGKGRKAAGFSVWALLEVLAGAVLPLYALEGGGSPGVLGVALFLTLALILFSSVLQVRRARIRRRHREDTESARLEVYVKYLSPSMREDQESTES